MVDNVREGLEKHIPKGLVDQLLETYEEMKKNYYLGRLRPNEVEGGRFAEAVFRILEFMTSGKYTPLDQKIEKFEEKCNDFGKIQRTAQPDSIRLHIPRTIRLIYDIRNKRDAAHLSDSIDPNLQDSSFVVACCDWVMSEFVRLFHGVSADVAYKMIENIVTKKLLIVQDFGGFLKTLNPRLGPSERIIILLYNCKDGATLKELSSWIKPEQRANLKRTLNNLEHERDNIVNRNGRYLITRRGILEVEKIAEELGFF